MSNPILITPHALAIAMHSAKVNLFGAISCKKEIDPNSRKQAQADEVLQGRRLYKVYGYDGMATMSDYEKSVNNARERAGLDSDFEKQELKWGEHFVLNGTRSAIVIVHKGKFYLQIRTTKNTRGKTKFVLSDGTEVSYDAIESFLKASDKFKRKSIEATAERQGLSVEDSVQVRTIAIDNITRLAYGGNVYEIVPEAVDAQNRPVSDEEREEPQTP